MNEAHVVPCRSAPNAAGGETDALGGQPRDGGREIVHPEADVVERRLVHARRSLRIDGFHEVDFDGAIALAELENVFADVFPRAFEGATDRHAEEIDPKVAKRFALQGPDRDLLQTQDAERTIGRCHPRQRRLGRGVLPRVAGILPAMPTQFDRQDDTFVLRTATHRLVIARAGARIVEYATGGKNVLSTWGTYVQQGSTFWVGPQSAWPEPWPPSRVLEEDPYEPVGGEVRNDVASVRLHSGSDADLGVAFEKEFTMYPDGSVRLRYTIVAEREVMWAPWEVTRLRPGLCFYGPGAYLAPILDPAVPNVPAIEEDGVAWVPFETGNDCFRTHLADASGWCGYAHDGQLLLKQFPTVPAADFAPGNGSLKIWWQNSDFIELEQLGAQRRLQAGERDVYDVSWSLHALRPEVEVAPRSPSLSALLPIGA